MKVSVITRHAIINYGSLLQTYATQFAINKLGYECEIINYIKKNESYNKQGLTILKQKANWYNNPFKRFFYILIRTPENFISGIFFKKERKKLLNLTRLYNSFDELKNNCPNADIYMTGSDQVWGKTEDGNYDESYFLSFVEDSEYKISYGSSFGRTNFTEDELINFKNLLASYNYLTVREESAVEIIKKIGYTSTQVLDPTLLLFKQEWNQLACKNITGKYILIYQLHNNKKFDEYVKKISTEKKVKIIRISPFFHQIVRPGKFKYCHSINEFLSYVKNADCVITDSFHGTVFSIIFNVKFVDILPNNNTETRIISILKLFGLMDRIIDDYNNLNIPFKEINYNNVNEQLFIKRNESLSILKNIISKKMN